MSAEPTPPEPTKESLQFERADFSASPALSCAFCKGPINGEYFQVNGQTACPKCRGQVEAEVSSGSSIARVPRALGAGIAAAIAGFLAYWGIRVATGYEFGLVAILVGWMVGVAVRWGAQQRGGLFYQLMAVVLTYFSIASTYTPHVLQGMREGRAGQSAPAEPAEKETAPGEKTTTAPEEKVSFPFWIELPFAFAISLAMPFLMGPSNIIGWIIIAFGLIQAWRLNKRIPVEVSGPFHGSAPGLQT